MADARLAVMQDAYWDWADCPGGSSATVDRMLRYLLDALDYNKMALSPSPPAPGGVRKIVAMSHVPGVPHVFEGRTLIAFDDGSLVAFTDENGELRPITLPEIEGRVEAGVE